MYFEDFRLLYIANIDPTGVKLNRIIAEEFLIAIRVLSVIVY